MTDASLPETKQYEAQMGDYFALLKPRVMSLVVFTALVGLLVAPVAVHPFIGFVAVLCIAVGAGASGALNMWWDADIDAVMREIKAALADEERRQALLNAEDAPKGEEPPPPWAQ